MWKSYLFNTGHSKYFKRARFAMPEGTGDEGGTGGLGAGGSAGIDSGDDDGGHDDGEEDGEDLANLKSELARWKAEAERFKKSNDKVLKEKKQLEQERRKNMDAEQLAKEAQEERDKEFEEMKRELRISRYSKRLVGMGMTEQEADTFADSIPEMEDSDAFFDTLSAFIRTREKAAGESAVQKLLKERPDIHAGSGDSAQNDDPAMQFARASIQSKKSQNLAQKSQDIINNYI